MEAEKKVSDILAMNGGSGPLSYANNSSYQRAAADGVKAMVNEAIAKNFGVNKQIPRPNPFRVADLGCSVGPNTFFAVQNIIEAVEQHAPNSNTPEFHIFFNDCASNDFNTLFASLPPDRRYFAAGVPGSYNDRLFPKASIHFFHSSYALQWLSEVPKQVLDRNSTTWNKERVHYTNAPKVVMEAYSAQFNKDLQSFLNARAQELAPDGLITLIIPAVPNGTPPCETFICLLYELLRVSLTDMASMGLLCEAKVNSFNLPIYYTSPHEFMTLVETNGHFRIENMTQMANQMKHKITILDYRTCVQHIRAGTEQLIKEHFGSEIVDELFNRFEEKVAAESSFIFKQSYLDNFVDLCVVLKHTVSN